MFCHRALKLYIHSQASAYSFFYEKTCISYVRIKISIIFYFSFSASVRRLSVAIMPYLGSEETVRELRRALSNPNVQSEPLRYRNTILKVIRLVPSGHRCCALLTHISMMHQSYVLLPIYRVHL